MENYDKFEKDSFMSSRESLDLDSFRDTDLNEREDTFEAVDSSGLSEDQFLKIREQMMKKMQGYSE